MILAAISLALAGGAVAKPVAKLAAARAPAKAVPASVAVMPPPADHMPLRIGMSFAEIRAATPGAVWKMTPVENYVGRHFVRVLAAPALAALDGLPLDVIAVRGPTDTVFAQHFVSRPLAMTKGDCFARFRRFSDAVGLHTGLSVKDWLPEIAPEYKVQSPPLYSREPWSFGLADQLVIGPSQFEANFVVSGSSIAPPPWPSSETDVPVPGFSPLSMSIVNVGKGPMLGWFGHFEQANVRWMVTGLFERDQPTSEENRVAFENPAETPGKCRMSVVSKTGNEWQRSKASSAQSAPPYPLFTRDQLRNGGRLADRYYALVARNRSARTDDEADIYFCSVSLRNGGLERCKAETALPKPAKGELPLYNVNALGFLASFAAPGPPINEDDFASRFVRVQFGFRPDDKLPEFDWNKTDTGKPSGLQLTRDLQISGGDYPPIAIRNNIEADVIIHCLVLSDLSVFCGHVTAQITSGTMPPDSTVNPEGLFTNEVSRMIIRRMRAANAYPQKLDGSDARGTYFRRLIKFRTPK